MSGPRLSIIPAAAVTDPKLEPRDLQVLCLLGRHIDDNGWCCRSQVQMARELSCGRATVQRSLARLVGAGYIEHRPKVRDSGADAAHDYRVILDPPARPQTADVSAPDAPPGDAAPDAESTAEGVPIDGQGVPIDGQGVPTHERAGGAQPCAGTNVNDPCLTTPAERGERERARAISDRDVEKPIPDLDLFERGKRRWPAAIGGHRDRELKVWAKLSHHDRVEAERSVEAVVEELKRRKRAHPPGWETYLRNRDWELVPRDRRARPATTAVTKLGREYLALAIRLIDEGRDLGPLAEALRRPLEPLRWAIDDMPGPEAIGAHTERIRADSPEGFAWRRWFAGRGLDLDLGLGPDLKGGGPRWLWLPARWPPGWDAARAEREMAAAAAEPRMSPETVERMRALGVDV